MTLQSLEPIMPDMVSAAQYTTFFSQYVKLPNPPSGRWADYVGWPDTDWNNSPIPKLAWLSIFSGVLQTIGVDPNNLQPAATSTQSQQTAQQTGQTGATNTTNSTTTDSQVIVSPPQFFPTQTTGDTSVNGSTQTTVQQQMSNTQAQQLIDQALSSNHVNLVDWTLSNPMVLVGVGVGLWLLMKGDR